MQVIFKRIFFYLQKRKCAEERAPAEEDETAGPAEALRDRLLHLDEREPRKHQIKVPRSLHRRVWKEVRRVVERDD